jgi:hypothetical protein
MMVLGIVAEMERKFVLERQRTGLEAAKAKGGVYKGRKPSVTGRRGAWTAWAGPGDITEALGVSRKSAVFRRWIAIKAAAVRLAAQERTSSWPSRLAGR